MVKNISTHPSGVGGAKKRGNPSSVSRPSVSHRLPGDSGQTPRINRHLGSWVVQPIRRLLGKAAGALARYLNRLDYEFNGYLDPLDEFFLKRAHGVFERIVARSSSDDDGNMSRSQESAQERHPGPQGRVQSTNNPQ